MSPFDNVQGGDAAFAAAVQSLTNPYAMSQYISTRAVLQPQLFLQGLLPPVRSTMSQILNGNVRIIAGAAKATAIDSPYHKVGGMQTQFTRNNTFKITSSALLNESDQDTMHEAAQSAIVTAAMNGTVNGMGAATPVYANYIARVIEAAALSMDLGEESYRAQALAYGKLDLFVSNGERKIPVKANYGVDFKKAFRDRTKGNTSYIGTQSAFWDDVQAARNYLLLAEPVMLTDPVTWQAIRSNPANAIIVTAQVQLTPTTQRLEIAKAAILSGEVPSGAFTNIDVNYRCTVIVYGLRDEETQNLYWPVGRCTWFTQTNRAVTLIDGVIVNGALGVTHQGPTTEIGNVPGRYLKGFIPENRPYHFVVEAAEDIVPDIQSWRNLFFAETAVKPAAVAPPSSRGRLQALFSPADLGAATDRDRDARVSDALAVAQAQRPAATPEQLYQHARAQLLELSIRQVLRGKTQINVPGEIAVAWDRCGQLQQLRQEVRAAYALAGLPAPAGSDWNKASTSVPVIATFGGPLMGLLDELKAEARGVLVDPELAEVLYRHTLTWTFRGNPYQVRCSITDPNRVSSSFGRATLMGLEADVQRDTRLLKVHPDDLSEQPPVGATVAWDGRTLRVVAWSQPSDFTGLPLGTCLLEG